MGTHRLLRLTVTGAAGTTSQDWALLVECENRKSLDVGCDTTAASSILLLVIAILLRRVRKACFQR